MTNERNAYSEAGASGEASALTILLADDDPGVRQLAAQLLRSLGYRVLEASDGIEALEVAERHAGEIHLLLTDWSMPRLDGGELIRVLTNGRPETAILVMTGQRDIESPAEASVLYKPFTPHDLVSSVNGALYGE